MFGQIFIGKYIATRVDKFKGCISSGDILELKYGKNVKMFSGLMSFFICSAILGAQVGTMGYIFKAFLGVPDIVGVMVGFGTILIYSTSGGIKADIITDVLQFFILIIGLPLLFIFGLNSVGGFEGIVQKVPSEYFDILNKKDIISFIAAFVSLMVGEMLAPPYVQRLLIGKSSKETSKATILSGYASLFFFAITGMIGLIAYAYNPDIEANLVIPSIIKEVMPVGVSGIIISSMLAIVLSTADTFLNSASVSIINDFYLTISRKKVKENKKLKLTRIANITTGIVAVITALIIPNMFDVLIFAYSFWGPTLLVPLLFALLDINTNKLAIWAGIISGIMVTLSWNVFYNGPYNIDGMVVGFAVNFLITSILTRSKKIKYIDY